MNKILIFKIGLIIHNLFKYSSYNIKKIILDMSLLTIVLTLIVVGILMWLIDILPIDPAIKRIIRIVIVIFMIIWLLKVFGLFAALGAVRI